MEFAKTTFPRGQRLDGLKVVVDCANGAAYRTAPEVLWELGAEVVPIGGRAGRLQHQPRLRLDPSPRRPPRRCVAHGADLGISLDGDADRVLIIDETGRGRRRRPVHGADRRPLGGRGPARQGHARRHRDVEPRARAAPRGAGPAAACAPPVGDRYVVEAMREGGYNLGGEQSGHIVMTDYVTTGDGLIAALQFLSAMVETGRRASELARVFPAFPQVLTNVRYRKGAAPLDEASVRAAIAAGEARMGGRGRLVIRKSGTEPLVRIMGECDDPELLRASSATSRPRSRATPDATRRGVGSAGLRWRTGCYTSCRTKFS